MSDTIKRGKRRLDYQLIESFVPERARVLDLGCGDGQLLSELAANKGCWVRGIEINEQYARECIRRGVPVYHGDMMEGMADYRDGAFDVVILSQTLQQAADPVRVIHEMLRVGRRAVISFPNFGYWLTRLQLLFGGRMPKHRLLPYEWFNTPNVHLCTIADFRDLCAREGLKRGQEVYVSPSVGRVGPLLANWRAAQAIFEVEKDTQPSDGRATS